MKVLIAILATLALFTGLGFWLGPALVDKIRSQFPSEHLAIVRVEKPTRGDLIELVQAPGAIEPETNVELSARISARIIELPFTEGQKVKAGDIVIRLDATDYESRLRAAEARRAAEEASLEVAKSNLAGNLHNIEAQEATLTQAQLDLKRNRGLLETKDVALSVVDELEARVKELVARLKASRESINAEEIGLQVRGHNLNASDADIEQRRNELGYTVIRTPIDGIVTKLNAEVGELVMTGTMNNAGTIIMEVADLSRMLLVAEVDESDIGAVKNGQTATVRINAYQGETFTGEVKFVALTNSVARDGSKYFRTEILVDTKGRQIYSGLTADVEIETKRHTNVLMVPSQAVLARNVDDLPLDIREKNPDVDMTKTYAIVVYRYVDHKAVVTPVTIGAIDLTNTLILSGLDENDLIVVGSYKILETIEHDLDIKDEVEKKAEEAAKENAASERTDDSDENAENADEEN